MSERRLPAVAAPRSVVGTFVIAGAELALHDDHVDPASKLEADGIQMPGLVKAERRVQGYRRGVAAVADHRHHLAPGGGPASTEERRVGNEWVGTGRSRGGRRHT